MVLERTYESPFLPHNCMEPMNFFAHVTAEKIHLVGPIQTPEGTAKGIAAKLERPFEDVHLEMTRTVVRRFCRRSSTNCQSFKITS